MAVINNITLLVIVLTGAALLREREHGTVEHLLVMPVRPAEIMIAKIWANGLVIVVGRDRVAVVRGPRVHRGAVGWVDAVVRRRYGRFTRSRSALSAYCSRPSPARWGSSACC